MIKTTRGLPNTCSKCGTLVKKEDGWFAKNEDEARSGLGLCEKCVKASQKPEEPAIQEKEVEQGQEPAGETASPQDEQGEAPGEVEDAPAGEEQAEQRKKRG